MNKSRTASEVLAQGKTVGTIKTFRNGDVLIAVELEGRTHKIRVPRHLLDS